MSTRPSGRPVPSVKGDLLSMRVRCRAGCMLTRMPTIDPTRHPLLHDVAQGARWAGTDEFPSCLEWANEHEAWLRFVGDSGALGRYMSRLRGPKERRDEAFAESIDGINALVDVTPILSHALLRAA